MSVADLIWLPVFLGLGLGSLRLSQRLFGHWFSPLSVFVGVNCTSLFLYHLRLIEISDVSLVTHLLVLGGLFCFSAGVLIVARANPRSAQMQPRGGWDLLRIRYFFLTTAALATVGWGLALTILVKTYGLTILLNNVWLLQLTFQMQFIGYLNLVGILVLPTYIIMAAGGQARSYDLFWVFSALLGLVLAGIKSYLIYSIVAGLTAWSTIRPRGFRIWYLAVSLVLLLQFFVLYNNLIDVFVYEDYGGVLSHPKLASLMRPYLYLVGSWPALDNLLSGEVDQIQRWGAATLYPVWKILGHGLGLVEDVDKNAPFTFIGTVRFNVYSFFGQVYFDWRWPGVLVISFLFGVVVTVLYLRARLIRFWGHHLIYSIFGYVAFLSFFSFIFEFKEYFLLLYCYLVGFVILRGGVLIAPDRPRSGGHGR